MNWNGRELGKLERRHPGIRVALRDLINVDRAGKVAESLVTNDILTSARVSKKQLKAA